jgi:hypothetical protein
MLLDDLLSGGAIRSDLGPDTGLALRAGLLMSTILSARDRRQQTPHSCQAQTSLLACPPARGQGAGPGLASPPHRRTCPLRSPYRCRPPQPNDPT